MKNTSYLFLLVLSLFACQKVAVKLPVFINPESIHLTQQDSLKFEVEGENWAVSIQTPVHIIYPEFTQENGQLTVLLTPKEGVIEGSAYVTLYHEEQHFNFPIYLKNQGSEIQLEDLRSPKTVNTDSSMVQQQILYAFDQSGNLTEVKEGSYFQENYLELSPKTGIFKGITGSAVSSYYVDPGTVKEIPLTYSVDQINQTLTIKAGPLLDQFQNTVANGTLVIFLVEKEGKTTRLEAVVQEAYSQFTFPLSRVKNANVSAKIAHISSATLTPSQL